MNLIVAWLVLTAAFYITAAILPGFHVRDGGSAFLVAAIFGVLNTLLGWFLYTVLGILTLGLGFLFYFITMWVVNAVVLKITDAITDRLTIDSFGWALGGALLISVIGTLAEVLVYPLIL